MGKETKTFKLFLDNMWPKHSKEVYSNLYYAYHRDGENYTSPFLPPVQHFGNRAMAYLSDAADDALGLGLVDSWKGKERWSGIATNQEVVLNWVEAVLFYDVLKDIVDEFRHHKGQYGIDEEGKGRYMDENLKNDYQSMLKFMGYLESQGYGIKELVDLTPIELVDESQDPPAIQLQEEKYRLSEVYSLWWKKEGRFLNEGELHNEPMIVRRHLYKNYHPQVKKLHLESNKKEILKVFKKINAGLVKSGLVEIDSHMVVGGLTTNPVVRQWMKEQIDPDNQPNKIKKPELNPSVVEGDVIQLIHMDDPWSPIPIATKGIVMGFEELPFGEYKILVTWVIDPDVPEFRDMPLIPEVDVWRKPKNQGPLLEIKKSLLMPLLGEQEIKYEKVSELKKFGNKQFVYFTGTDESKDPSTANITLIGPQGTIDLDSLEVKNAKFGGLQVNYNRETKDTLDRLLNFVDPNKECDFVNKTLHDNRWERGGEFRNQTFRVIQNSLKDVYPNNVAGKGEPTPLHIPNGFINIPGTDAGGTTVGWSIVNFFNTNPVVRRILVQEFQEHVKKNNLPCRFNIYDFTDWVGNNKYDIFGLESPLFKKLVKANQSSWENGRKNENDVIPYLENFYGDEWFIISGGEPGLKMDALSGVDLEVVNKETGEKHLYQAKPLGSVEELKNKDGVIDRWKVHSGWLHKYTKPTHFIFGPNANGGAVIFKNHFKPPINGGKQYVFNYPPLTAPL